MELLELCFFQAKFNYFVFLLFFVFFNGQAFWYSLMFALASFIGECVRITYFKLCMFEAWPDGSWFFLLPFASDVFFVFFSLLEMICLSSSFDLLPQLWFSTLLSICCLTVFKNLYIIDPKLDDKKLIVFMDAASILMADVSLMETLAILVCAHVDVIFFWIFFCLKLFMFSGICTGLISSFFFLIFSCLSMSLFFSARMKRSESPLNSDF